MEKIFSFKAALEKSDNKLWGCHVQVPRLIAQKLIHGDSRRVICTLNKQEQYQCAILHYRKGISVISINKKIRDKIGLDFGSFVNVRLSSDTSEYGLPIPDELREVFRQDKTGKKLFHALTPGKQRTLLYIIGKGKNSETIVIRSLAILQHLKENKGKIDFKLLNICLKNAFRIIQNRR